MVPVATRARANGRGTPTLEPGRDIPRPTAHSTLFTARGEERRRHGRRRAAQTPRPPCLRKVTQGASKAALDNSAKAARPARARGILAGVPRRAPRDGVIPKRSGAQRSLPERTGAPERILRGGVRQATGRPARVHPGRKVPGARGVTYYAEVCPTRSGKCSDATTSFAMTMPLPSPAAPPGPSAPVKESPTPHNAPLQPRPTVRTLLSRKRASWRVARASFWTLPAPRRAHR